MLLPSRCSWVWDNAGRLLDLKTPLSIRLTSIAGALRSWLQMGLAIKAMQVPNCIAIVEA